MKIYIHETCDVELRGELVELRAGTVWTIRNSTAKALVQAGKAGRVRRRIVRIAPSLIVSPAGAPAREAEEKLVEEVVNDTGDIDATATGDEDIDTPEEGIDPPHEGEEE